jgi:hypothetical protein
MAEAEQNWIDELAAARDDEQDTGEEHPAEQEPQEALEAKAPEPEKDDHVPLATFIEQRNKLTAKIDALEQQLQQRPDASKIEGLREQIEALRAERQAQKEQQPPPDYLDDPKAYIDHTTKSVVEQLQALGNQVKESQETQAQTKEQLQQQQQIQSIIQAAGAAEAAFAERTADYWDALEHLRQVRRGQLQLAAPEATAEQLEQAIRAEEFQTAAGLLTRGMNPAEYAYNFAKTLGYTGKQAEGQETDDMAERREQAQGMGGSGMSRGDLEQMLEMNQDEFDQAMKETFG